MKKLDFLNGFLNWFSTTGAVLVSSLGLPGIFIASLALNSAFFFGIPMEILLLAFYYASGTNPAIIALVAGTAAGIGEMAVYYFGMKSKGIAARIEKSKNKWLQKAKKEINAKGPIAVFILYVLPLPVDFVGLFSGIMKMDWKKFFIAALIGKIARYYLMIIFIAFGIEIIAKALGF